MIVQGRRVLYNNELQPAQVRISTEGVILNIEKGYDDRLHQQTEETVVDAGDLLVMPGIVDAHVHINEPGRTDWEGFETATKAAAAGGITTMVDMPLNCSPVTTTVDSLKIKLPHAEANNLINIAFWGGIIPGSQAEIKPMISEGVRGFKCFLIHSGIDEFPHCTELDLHLAYEQLKGTDSVFLFHAEVDVAVDENEASLADNKYAKFLHSRPESMEVEAIELVIRLCKQYNVRSHIVHLSSAAALPLIREAQEAGAPLTVETCHHYLTLTSEKVPNGRTEYKCCPPIRSKKNQEELWAAIKEGTITMVVSDHSPCVASLKDLASGDFMTAWGGISGLQLGLSLYWSSARERGISVSDLSEVMSANTAKHAGLHTKVGQIVAGLRGDLVIWDPDQSFEVTEDLLYHKNKLSPYLGMTLYGRIDKTIIGGKIAYECSNGFAESKNGQIFLD